MYNIIGIMILILFALIALALCIEVYSVVRRKNIIKEFARELAGLHKAADIYYNDSETKTWLIDKESALFDLALRLDIVDEVYEEAYKIYDFRKTARCQNTTKVD
jgi:hypothetical protein